MTEITLNDRIQENTAVALGLFDGVHEGHEIILRNAGMYSLQGYATCCLYFQDRINKIQTR